MRSKVIQPPLRWLYSPHILPKAIIISILFLLLLRRRPYRKPPPVRVDEACDVSRGEWVRDADEAPPRYTNSTCATIQEHQNCMKYGRPDTDFLRWRWKPDGCELLRFDPSAFLEIVRGKSLAFVGDSLARNHMQSLMCLLSQVENPRDISLDKDENFKRVVYAWHDFKISIFWSPFLVKADEPNRQNNLWKLYLDEADDKWSSQVEQFDYVIISAGNWFTRPSLFYEKQQLVGCHYCQTSNITDLTLRYSHRMAVRTALRTINEMADFRGAIFLRTISPSHFENGEWNRGGNCVRRKPFGRNEARLEGADLEFYEAQVEEFENAKRTGTGRGLEFRLLDTAECMLLRPDGHPSRYGHWPHENVFLYNDCVHWCLPGPIDVWNDFLLHMLRARRRDL